MIFFIILTYTICLFSSFQTPGIFVLFREIPKNLQGLLRNKSKCRDNRVVTYCTNLNTLLQRKITFLQSFFLVTLCEFQKQPFYNLSSRTVLLSSSLDCTRFLLFWRLQKRLWRLASLSSNPSPATC